MSDSKTQIWETQRIPKRINGEKQKHSILEKQSILEKKFWKKPGEALYLQMTTNEQRWEL